MTELVYVADWQIQCCGEEFAVGDVVTWPILARDRSDDLWEVDEEITGTYDSHGDEPLPEMTGVVRRIRTMSCQYAAAPPPADPRERVAVAGTAVVEDVMAIEKWYGTGFDPDVLVFCGWLVDLEVPQ